MQGIQASDDEYKALVKSGKSSELQEHWCMVGATVKTDVEKGIM